MKIGTLTRRTNVPNERQPDRGRVAFAFHWRDSFRPYTGFISYPALELLASEKAEALAVFDANVDRILEVAGSMLDAGRVDPNGNAVIGPEELVPETADVHAEDLAKGAMS